MFRLMLVLAFATFTLALPTARSSLPQLDGRIVGGSPADITSYPYQVSMLYQGSHICGGSIISANYIVTAAHCTDGASASALSIRAGSSSRVSGGQVVAVSQIHQNPNYNSNTIDYDISILRLSQGLTMGSGVRAISLPALNQNTPAGTNAVVTGWGTLTEGSSSLPTQLQAVTVPVVAQNTCKSAYGSSAITDRMICAGVTAGGKDACQGDSGGPLQAGGQLIGVVSWGYGCARPSYPGIYSNVANLRNYITTITGI